MPMGLATLMVESWGTHFRWDDLSSATLTNDPKHSQSYKLRRIVMMVQLAAAGNPNEQGRN
jgi:hypothetical protein